VFEVLSIDRAVI